MDDIQNSSMKELYPELYELIYPNVTAAVDAADLSGEISAGALDEMIDGVLMGSGIGLAPAGDAEAVPAQSGFGDRLRSLIRILILKEILKKTGRPMPPPKPPQTSPACPPENRPLMPPARPPMNTPPVESDRPAPPANRPGTSDATMTWPQMPPRPRPRSMQSGGRAKLPPKPPRNIY